MQRKTHVHVGELDADLSAVQTLQMGDQFGRTSVESLVEDGLFGFQRGKEIAENFFVAANK